MGCAHIVGRYCTTRKRYFGEIMMDEKRITCTPANFVNLRVDGIFTMSYFQVMLIFGIKD